MKYFISTIQQVRLRPTACRQARGLATSMPGRMPSVQPTFTYKPPPFDPETRPNLTIELPCYDLDMGLEVDVLIAGAGPAGVATAARLGSHGLRVVVVDPDPLKPWPNNYGVWVDDFEAMGLEDCFEREWSRANVWLGDGKERCASMKTRRYLTDIKLWLR
jgi:hypothetical protein